MNKKYRIAILILVCMGLALNTKAQVTPFVAGRLQFTLDSICNRYNIKGTSAAVLIPNMGIWKSVNGVSQEGVPLSTDMLFGMGSNTKTFIAATLLKMQEQQLISLNDTIGKWITGYPNINGKVTIRQCLNHTSGIFDYLQNATINDSILGKPEKRWTREEILFLAKAPLFAPGASWDYSNTNYIICGIIIEKVLNKSPFQAINELILQPNELLNTVDFNEKGNRSFAHPWSMIENGQTLTDMTTTPYLEQLFSLANTAGSLITSSEDNVLFWHKLFTGQIVNAQSWREMTTMVNLSNNTQYGLGIFRYNRRINGRTAYSHGGTFFGYINENIVDTTSGVTIAVLTNQDSINNNGLLDIVIKALHRVTLNMPPVGINEFQPLLAVNIRPNPVSNTIWVELEANGTYLTLYDMHGRMVLSESETNTIDVSGIANGMYILHATKGGLYYQQRLVVQH